MHTLAALCRSSNLHCPSPSTAIDWLSFIVSSTSASIGECCCFDGGGDVCDDVCGDELRDCGIDITGGEDEGPIGGEE